MNKTLFMWLAWVASVTVWRRRPEPSDRVARGTTIVAAIVMICVYLVPHSLRGSQLDYARAEAKGDARDAITTGR